MTKPSPARDHFREHLHDVTEECMIWPYATASGYGKLRIRGRNRYVTEMACEAWHGPRPPGAEVAHGPCHNRACWNGAHLSWKTKTENQADKRRDGTHAQGETVNGAKLTEAGVREIRARYASGGVLQRELAAEYGVAPSQIHMVVHRKTWAHVS